MWRALSVCVGVMLPLMAPRAASAQEARCPDALAARAFSLDKPARLLVMPAEPPPSKTTLSLDAPDGRHHELLWDPEVGGATSRDVLLEPGCWQVSWNIQPLRHPQNPTVDVAWRPVEPWRPAASCAANADPTLARALLGCAAFSVQRGAQGNAATLAQLPVLMLRAPKTTLAQAAGRWKDAWSGPGLSRALEERTAAAADSAALSAKDTLKNISGAVLLKAQDKAMESARARIQRTLRCDTTTPPFPNTCQLLSIIRLADLMVIGESLKEVLFADLIRFASRNIARELKLDAIGARVLDAGLEMAASFARRGVKPTDQEIAGTFVAMTSVYAEAAAEVDKLDPVTQGAVLAIAVMGECARLRDCSGKRVFSMIRERDAHFELGAAFKLDPAWWPEPELVDMIGRGLAIMQPTRHDASIERAMAVSHLTFTLIPRHLCISRRATSLDQCQQQHPKPLARLQSARHLIEGAILRDPQRGLLALNELLAAQDDERRMLAALGSFILNAPQEAAADAQAQLAARQQSMEQLIEALTQREARQGDLVFGLHGSTSLGLTALSASFGADEAGADASPLVVSGSASDVFAQPLSLTVGLSAQRYFSESLGLSVAIDLLELGRWASFTEGTLNDFAWTRALYPALTISLLAGDADLPIFIGARAGYSPLDDAAFVGLNLGVYVPLFDFN